MKRIKIDIRTENAAFTDDPEVEVSRILVKLANNLHLVHDGGRVFDMNGNSVGIVKITK